MRFRTKDGQEATLTRQGQTIKFENGAYETDDHEEVAWLSTLPFIESEQAEQARVEQEAEAEEQPQE